MLTIGRATHDDPELRALIARLDAELLERYPEEDATHFSLTAADVAPGHGAILVARQDGVPMACGAVRLLPGGAAAELKRMYTAPEARGLGLARQVLAALEEIARELGARQLLLETGVRQPEALRLYERAGYAAVPAWAEYVGSPLSVCLGKSLG